MIAAALFPTVALFAAVGLLVLAASSDRACMRRTVYELALIAAAVAIAATPLLLLTL